jgi:hypothetical protein
MALVCGKQELLTLGGKEREYFLNGYSVERRSLHSVLPGLASLGEQLRRTFPRSSSSVDADAYPAYLKQDRIP